ncbi:MAG: O-antigen ligase family protein [Kiritimatiellia bacterium]
MPHLISTVAIEEAEPGKGWVVGVCLLAGLVLGAVVASLSVAVFLAVVGALLGPIFLARNQRYGPPLVLACTCFISFYSKLPKIPIGSIHLPDMLLLYLVALYAWSLLKGRLIYHNTLLARTFLLFLAFSSLSFIYGVVAVGANAFEAMREFKVVLYYGLFIMVSSSCTRLADVKWLMVVCFGIGMVSALTLVIGGILNPPSPDARAEDVYYGIAGLAGGKGILLIYWCLCCCFALLVVDRTRLIYLAAMGIYLLFFILKFHRHMYMSIALAALLTGLFAFRRYRQKMGRILGLTFVLLLLTASMIAWGPPVLGRYVELSWKRLQSLQGIESTETVTYRLLENQYAWIAIKHSPLVGIGYANGYRPAIYGPKDNLATFIHNGYLWILVKSGFLGFMAFLALFYLFLKQAMASWARMTDGIFRGIILGSAVCILGLLLANMSAPYFMQDWEVAAIGILFGITEAAVRISRQAAPEREEIR